MSKDLGSGVEMRTEGLLRLSYYVEDMSGQMESDFERNKGLEDVCDEMIHDREMRWDLTEWREGSFKHTPEGIIEVGTYLLEVGKVLSEVSNDRDQLEVYKENFKGNIREVEDIGFYLVEMGLGLRGLGSLWRVVDPDMDYDVVQWMCR